MQQTVVSIMLPSQFVNNNYGLAVDNIMTSALKNAGVIHKIAPLEVLDTGDVFAYYRISENYVLVEKVFVGRTKSFLSGYELWSRTGHRIQTAYGIREKEYDKLASYQMVKDELLTYVKYSEKPIDTDMLELFPEDDFMTEQQFKVACSRLSKQAYILKK